MRDKVQEWHVKMSEAQKAVDWLILAEPTGPLRELLTDANIALMKAETLRRQVWGIVRRKKA
jgi:hypothetical protein